MAKSIPRDALAMARFGAALAEKDAASAAARMHSAMRVIQSRRFLDIWPSPGGDGSVRFRTLLRNWWKDTVDAQFTHQGEPGVLDGARAEAVITAGHDNTGVDRKTVQRVVATLGADAVVVSRQLSLAARRFTEAGQRGRVNTWLPRLEGVELGTGQAIGEQWYGRCFRAALEPQLFGRAGRPVTDVELRIVAAAMATGQAVRLHDDHGKSLLYPGSGDGFEQVAAHAWQGMLFGERRRWLRGHLHHNPKKAAALADTDRFEQLPLLAQVALLKQHPPRVLDGFRPEPLTGGTPAGRAGQMFGRPALEPNEADRAAARHLFQRGTTTIPGTTLPLATDAIGALDSYARETTDSQHRRSLSRRHVYSEESIRRAAELRRDGASWPGICEVIGGGSPGSFAQKVKDSGILTPEEYERGVNWDDTKIRAARTLLAQGVTQDETARVFGGTSRSLGSALRRHSQREAQEKLEKLEQRRPAGPDHRSGHEPDRSRGHDR